MSAACHTTYSSFRNFDDAWSAQGKSNNPVLVNRVAAACTLEVSTTVDSGKFNQVFSWLIREGIIPAYPAEEDQDWFSKNIFLLKIIKDEFGDELRDNKTDEFYLSHFIWVLYENLSNPFSLKKQIVKYGAPGTGKTYQARQQTSLLFDIWKEEFAPNSSLTHASQIELVQFHPSFSYEDFMEGLRPVLDGNGTAQLTLQNGVFKEFCRNAGKWEIDICGLGLDRDWESITIDELRPHQEKLTGDHWQYIFEISDASKLVSDAVPPFFFIIDKVNRAELSRVFGELMYCLGYRGTKGSVKTQYANLNDEGTGMLQTDQGYNVLIDLSKQVISQQGSDFDSQHDSSAFFFDISMLFEYFIRKLIKRDGVRLLSKFEQRYEIQAGALGSYMRKLEPDLVFESDGGLYVFDVKYKAFDPQFGVKRDDLFQLYTYIGQYGKRLMNSQIMLT